MNKKIMVALGLAGVGVVLLRLVLDAISRYANPNPPG